MENKLLHIETEIASLLKDIYDPEIPVNIYDLGLIYDIGIDENHRVRITMTLTAPNCPVADDLLREVKERIETIKGVRDAEINLVFDPPWDPSMLSDEARLELGML
jgi:FeS assembly SUF system protein